MSPSTWPCSPPSEHWSSPVSPPERRVEGPSHRGPGPALGGRCGPAARRTRPRAAARPVPAPPCPLPRRHARSPAAALGAPLVALALAVDTGPGRAAAELLVIGLLPAAGGTVTTMAVARTTRRAERGGGPVTLERFRPRYDGPSRSLRSSRGAPGSAPTRGGVRTAVCCGGAGSGRRRRCRPRRRRCPRCPACGRWCRTRRGRRRPRAPSSARPPGGHRRRRRWPW